MGIRLVESIKLSCSGANPRWGMGSASAAILFDGEFFAVSCRPADCQPDGAHFDLGGPDFSAAHFPEALAAWYAPAELELVELADLACDGYIAEPVAA